MKRMAVNAPIPGQSLTKKPKNYPWEKPPQLVDVNDVIKKHLEIITEEDSIDNILFVLEAGLPINIFVETFLTNAVMKGVHTVDVSVLVAPILHEFILGMAEDAGVDFKEFPQDLDEEDKKFKEKIRTLISKSLADTPEKERDSGYELVKELEGAVEELPEKKPEERSKGLMSRKPQDGI
jgi:hypothetical protein